MNKQETVKDDGRILIYYTFPTEESGSDPIAENEEDAHV